MRRTISNPQRPEHRTAIVKVLTAALPLIYDGTEWRCNQRGRVTAAIEWAYTMHPASITWDELVITRQMLESRLKVNGIHMKGVSEWLCAMGYLSSSMTPDAQHVVRIQNYRRQWVRALIEEFSQPWSGKP